MLIEEQIADRRLRARKEAFKIKPQSRTMFGDYQVFSPASKRIYRVALRGAGLFDNYCACPDYAVNTLGTCKHIEAVLLHARSRFGGKLEKSRYRRKHTTIFLDYREQPRVRIVSPAKASAELLALREEYFDAEGFLKANRMDRVAQALSRFRALDENVVIYGDALEWVDRETAAAEGLAFEARELRLLEQGKLPLDNLLKVPLYPFQMRGVLFAACRGRTILADDMGLGKTIQAIGTAELLARRQGIGRTLVICPASVKHQWLTEIKRFSDRSAVVIDGSPAQRRALYNSEVFFKIVNYELVRRDLDNVSALLPDLIVLDEAQRIRNWETATARTIKLLRSRYALVLTGTPLENKLEELYSVVQFVDGRRLGPAFRFVSEHRQINEKGKLIGYRNLDQVREKLAPILLRRRRDQVLKDLPPRTDKIFRVPMSPEQAEYYGDQQKIVAALVRKLERQGWLSPVDQQRMLCAIQNMRMLCDSTFLFDKETEVSPKLEELREILQELVFEEERKVVIFSEWEKMNLQVGSLLDKMKIGYVSLHGGIPTRRRGQLIARFRDRPEVRVFLSTDAGGVGINLQAASAVINIEPPWNPARLEQRIARVHRMGQVKPVLAIHLLTENSIEERVWDTIRLKKELFRDLFDGDGLEVSFERLGRRSMMDALKEVVPETAAPATEPEIQKTDGKLSGHDGRESSAKPVADGANGASHALGMFLEAGLKFLESLSSTGSGKFREPRSDGPELGQLARTIEAAISPLIKKDSSSDNAALHIPLPSSLTSERIAQTITAALSRLMAG
ncbi:MAG TPA: DEAD/DEAH box helicase [Candidatus Binatia bacterium]|jgi:SNF2 family DNA or RNA helicase|nr:DEAD/DEAH box helicase [Candidatus Binatia bacterium]